MHPASAKVLHGYIVVVSLPDSYPDTYIFSCIFLGNVHWLLKAAKIWNKLRLLYKLLNSVYRYGHLPLAACYNVINIVKNTKFTVYNTIVKDK